MNATTDPQPEPRFPDVSRRAFLRRSALMGLAAAAVPMLTACGESMSTATEPASDGSPSVDASPLATTPPGAVTDTPLAPRESTGSAVTTTSQVFASGAQLNVDFTYAASGGERVDSPYIAVWIEDQAGDLVQTVSLWYASDESKYLRDLKRWNSKNNRAALTTGATRIPGSFSVAWDGTNLDGAIVDDGDYVVCIEAAREDGPYQIVCESIAVNASLVRTALTPSGELTAASVELVA